MFILVFILLALRYYLGRYGFNLDKNIVDIILLYLLQSTAVVVQNSPIKQTLFVLLI